MPELVATSRKNEIHVLEDKIITLIQQSRRQVTNHINHVMVYTYFEIGREIVEVEQKGAIKAKYGERLIANISKRLVSEFGKGFSPSNLAQMRLFYLTYSDRADDNHTLGSKGSSLPILQTASVKFNLSWSHYLFLMRIDNPDERTFYEREAINEGWSLRELKRQFNSSLFERLVLSRDKKDVKQLSAKGQIITKPEEIIKDPYVLEFVGLPEQSHYTESTLEQRLIDKLQTFLLELGKGFTFVGRQVRFTFEEKHFRVDLVFYNRLLQCFVLIDLKTEEITHQDIGQMQMYVHYYDRFVKQEFENPTVGILLCKDKNDAIVELTLPEDNSQIFASKYKTILPDKKELQRLLDDKDFS